MPGQGAVSDEDARTGPGRQRAVFIVAPGGLKERGGMGRLVSHITQHWSETGSGPAYRVIDPWGPRFLPVMPFFFARALVQILWQALRGRIALLHVHMASWGSVLRKGVIVRLAYRLGIPVVLHLHAGDFLAFYERMPSLGKRWTRGVLERADRLVVLSEGWRRALAEGLKLDARRLVSLPNAVPGPPEEALRRGGAEAGPGPDGCRILFLGRLEAAKGVPELIAALADPRLAGLDWRASLVGAGAVEDYRRQAERLGIGERLEFPGWQDSAAVRRRLAEADIFVLPSHFEGLSMALLEALAYGLAVVATRVGAAEEIVEDGVSGLLIRVGDHEALVMSILRLVSDPILRAALQKHARQRFNDSFDISTYCRNLERIYEDVLRDRAGQFR